jgi:hypothetical protein
LILTFSIARLGCHPDPSSLSNQCCRSQGKPGQCATAKMATKVFSAICFL